MGDNITTIPENDKIAKQLLHSERTPKPQTLKQEQFGGNTQVSKKDSIHLTNSNHKKTNTDDTVDIIAADIAESPSIFSTNLNEKYSSVWDFLTQVFAASHIILLLFFVVVYLVVYFIFTLLLTHNGTKLSDVTMSRIFDLLVFVPIVIGLVYMFLTSGDTNWVLELWNWSIDYMDEINHMFGLIIFGIGFYIMVYALGIPMSHDLQPYSIHLLESKIWVIFASFLLLMIIKHIFGVDLLLLSSNLFAEIWNACFPNHPVHLKGDNIVYGNAVVNNKHSNTKHTTTPPTPTVSPQKPSIPDQVFNIGNNKYTYEDAQSICSAYGARLATYNEIEDAYNHGGEWCNYGWSDGQMIFFPTQKSTWDALQKNPKMKNACGRPGVNGGYIDNPYMKFGVNCFGKKPDKKDSDFMNKPVIIPPTEKEAALDAKVQFWKDNKDKLLQINSFNSKDWSEF